MTRLQGNSYLRQLLTVFDLHRNPSQYAPVTSGEALSRCDVKGYVRVQAAPRMERVWDVLVVGVLLVAAAFAFLWFLPQ